MISAFETIEMMFEEINSFLDERVHFYVIGGAVLLYRGLKTETKDVDIIVDTKQEFKAVENALKDRGFLPKIPTLEYTRVDLNQIFIKGEFRIDLFQRTVCKGFQLSTEMKERAEPVMSLKNLSVSLCSNADIFLFKTFTERDADIDDCLLLAQKGLDWNAMLAELKAQIKVSKNRVWITWIGERLDVLEDRGLTIPIMGQVNRLRDAYFRELELVWRKNSKKSNI